MEMLREAPHEKLDFPGLLQAHRGILLKIAHTYCWDGDGRADLLQEMATQLWRAWPRYDPDRPFTTWMYRIALNVAISYVRKEARRRRHAVPFNADLHDAAAPDPAGNADARLARLRAFIERQPPLDRALLLLYLDERPQKEIADVLGTTPTNVSTRINRLKQRIRTEV